MSFGLMADVFIVRSAQNRVVLPGGREISYAEVYRLDSLTIQGFDLKNECNN